MCVSTPVKTQLQLYLDEPKLKRTDDIDILSFWKSYQYRYPQLSLMARDLLAIPVSTVASESAFSVGGRVIDSFRSTLKHENVEALICTRDWLFQKQGTHFEFYVVHLKTHVLAFLICYYDLLIGYL